MIAGTIEFNQIRKRRERDELKREMSEREGGKREKENE